MRTRNSGNPKPAPPPKKTPPSRRSAAKTPPKPPQETDVTHSADVEDVNPPADDVEVTPETKPTRGGKTRSSGRKAASRTKIPTPTRSSSRRTSKSNATKEIEVEETLEKDEVEDNRDEESVQREETSQNVVEESKKEAEPEKKEVGDQMEGESSKKEESNAVVEADIENVEATDKKGSQVLNIEEHSRLEEKTGDMEQPMATNVGKSLGQLEGTLETLASLTHQIGRSSTGNPRFSPETEREMIAKDRVRKAFLKALKNPSDVNPSNKLELDEYIKRELTDLSILEIGCMRYEIELETKEEENAIDPEPEEDSEENDVTGDQQQKANNTNTEELLVTDAGKSSAHEEDAVALKLKEDPEEDDENIDQQEEEKIETKELLNQSVTNVEEPSEIDAETFEKDEPSKTVGDTIDTEHPLDQIGMDIEESSTIEEKKEEPLETIESTIDTEQPLDQSAMDIEKPSEVEAMTLGKEENLVETVANLEEPMKTNEEAIVIAQPLDSVDVESTSQELGTGKNEEVLKEELVEEMKTLVEKVSPDNEGINMETDVMEEDVNQISKEKDAQVGCDESSKKERESGGKAVVEELKKNEDEEQEHVDAAYSLEVERAELNAAAKERKLRKELEIFVGGLDHDATEEDLKKAFENIGGVVEVRLLKDSSNKNKGYAFVEFATKELASQALLEMKTPLIRGKQCRTAPSEDNDMLFLGNICNTWTKETVKQKLKDYGIESVENINVVPDARHEGLSRGFAFLEFSCHADAMQAYKRLQKQDVIFGHTERTAKVAFAEPIREPDPGVMAQVKTVFVDGLPPQWTEDKVREKMKGYGEIVRISLSRNMSTAKRRDYGFVDFTTHEAAVACIEGINSENFGEGNSKRKVRARLSNPLPKAQPVKGGMCGGFRIGCGGGTTSSSRPGRGFGLGGNAFNQHNVQHDRGFYQRGRGQTGRVGFTRDHDVHMQYPPFQRREMFGRGAWRDPFVAPHDPFAGGPTSLRPPPVEMRHNVAADRGRGRYTPNSRLPFPPERGYNEPLMRRQMDDPYFYDGRPHGIKRPFSMTDQEPDYMDRSRLRPRIDYSDSTIPYRAPAYRDTFGPPDRNLHPHDYYGPDYHEGPPRPAFYGNERPYGRGYPPRY